MDSTDATLIPSGRQFYSPGPEIGSRDKNVGWYSKTFHGTPDDARELLESYARIPPEDVDSHVLVVVSEIPISYLECLKFNFLQRDKAWDVYPYPCIGQFLFLNLRLKHQPSYASMMENLKHGAKYLEIGFFLGQDIRKLVADGAPSQNIYGVELEAPFIELGYDLFRDRATLQAQFMAGDIFDLNNSNISHSIIGEMDYIYLGMILHVFDRHKQRLLLENCIRILKPQAGALILREAVGDMEGLQVPAGNFMHSNETFRQMWEEISERTGLKFDCRLTLDNDFEIPEAKKKWGYDRSRRLAFEVEIVRNR